MADQDGTPVLFTIGYEGRTAASLVRTLRNHGVEVLVDVRQTAASRTRGFSAFALYETLRKAGIEYEHVPGLGNPPEVRTLFHQGRIDLGRERYRSLLLDGRLPHLEYLTSLAKLRPVAILCRERDPGTCHRAVVAEVAVDNSGVPLRVEHL